MQANQPELKETVTVAVNKTIHDASWRREHALTALLGGKTLLLPLLLKIPRDAQVINPLAAALSATWQCFYSCLKHPLIQQRHNYEPQPSEPDEALSTAYSGCCSRIQQF